MLVVVSYPVSVLRTSIVLHFDTIFVNVNLSPIGLHSKFSKPGFVGKRPCIKAPKMYIGNVDQS